jgi:PAS domain S-box-containing protein
MKKWLPVTLLIVFEASPLFAQGGRRPELLAAQSIYQLASILIVGSLIAIVIVLWSQISHARKLKSFYPATFFFSITLVVLIIVTHLVDAFRLPQPSDWLTIGLRVLTALGLFVLVFVLYRHRIRFRRNEAGHLEKLVNERTSDLNALNQRLQLEIESRKLAEREVAKREKRFRAMIENISDGIVLNDENTMVLYQSPSVTRILGYTFEERQRKPVLNYIHPDDKVGFLKLYEDLAAQPGQPLPFQFRFKHKNGNYIWLEGVVTNLLHDRNVNGYVANYRDITGRKAAEESLRQERYLLRTLIDNVPDYIYIKDSELRHVINNKANVELIGAASEEETIGKTVSDYFDADIADQFMEADREVLASGKPVLNLEEKISGHDKKVRWLLTSKIPLIEDGNVVGLVGISRDITELKKAELALKDLNAALSAHADRLLASNAELERFAYVASHDLQEPLRMVRSFLQLLQKKTEGHLDPEGHQFIDFAVEGAERMKQLISDLLEYSRLGAVQEKIEQVDMNVLVQQTLQTLRDSISTSNAELQINPLPTVTGVRTQLGQLMQNLVGNAIKYSSNGPPQIKIEGSEQTNHWKFAISDKGIGIDPRFHEQIFVMFQRLHSEGQTKGTGIGLAICKKIVESHGGQIWVESKPDSGSTFHFTLARPNPTAAELPKSTT